MKKYSEKFLNNSDILKNSVVGIELEFYMKDLSYYKTLELLNQYLDPVRVYGFREYHPDFKPTADMFCLTPDLSGGQNLVELITGPMPYYDAKFYMIKILKFIQENGYTTDKASIHYNISFNDVSDKNLNDLNVLKLILNTDEDEIYRVFPSRQNNVYAKTVRKIIPYKEYDFNNIPIDIVKNNLRLPNDKYYGINFLHINKDKEGQRLEFRYVGGKDYEKNIGQIIYFLDRFVINVYNSIDTVFNDSDINKLEDYLDKNISYLKTFSKYDNFIVEFPTINIQIDQNTGYDVVNAYYPKIYNKLYTLIDSTQDLKECIINYVTTFQRIEIIDANIKSNFNLKDYDFINCVLSDGIFESCSFVNSEITNSQLIKSKIYGTKVKSSKVLNCNVEASVLNDCFFMNGYLNGGMIGGIFRSGKLGPYSNISSDTKIVSETDNFFDTTFDEDEYDKSKDGGVMKGFKK
jgi:hypothetical protein